MKSDKFELTENAAVEDHKAANAIRYMADGIPIQCIEQEELDALHAMIENQFREREDARTKVYAAKVMQEFDGIIAQLKRPH
jgi:hypothetical protein